MPTSATGSHNREAGFTLVEVLVVMAIAGLMAAVVAINMPAPGGSLVREGERLAARLLAARDNAILANRETAAVFDARGYHFVERDGKAWRPLDGKPLDAAAWRDGTRLVSDDAATPRVGFDSVGMSEPRTLVLVNGDDATRISIAASGEVRVDAPR